MGRAVNLAGARHGLSFLTFFNLFMTVSIDSPQASSSAVPPIDTRSPEARAPESLTLQEIVQSLPRECFQQDARKAWGSVALSIVTLAIGYAAIAFSPWYLLPLAWIWTGTAITGWFVIGHDCGHRSFAKTKWLNDLVGHVAFLPLLYPFHSWRILHDHHHRHTNKLGEDNAWEPFTIEQYDSASPLVRGAYWLIRGWFWWIGSIFHWALLHFAWWNFEGKQRDEVRFSALFVIIGGAIGLPLLITTVGWLGFVKFWVMPWLGYHFWMSTFTIVHHTASDIPFKREAEWNQALAQLCGSVHCDYPRWVEVLCHDINVHVPHHITTAIPSYNLRLAHESLRQNWGSLLRERQFNWELMSDIANRCHLYDPDRNYQSFSEHAASR